MGLHCAPDFGNVFGDFIYLFDNFREVVFPDKTFFYVKPHARKFSIYC